VRAGVSPEAPEPVEEHGMTVETELKGKHFITTQEWSVEQIESVLRLAGELKRARAERRATRLLEDKTLYLIFFDASTRTRNSFETGMTQLGGHAIYLSPDRMQISHGENAKDTACVLSRYGEGIAVRHCASGEGNAYLREIARYASVPVINMQCDVYHPCQVLADLLTIREKLGTRRGLKLGVAWTSAPNYVRPISVPQSLILLMPRFGIDVTLAYPPEFRLTPEIEAQARKNASEAGTRFEVTHRFEDAFADADAVIPKSWGPLVATRDRAEGLALIEKYPGWRCDRERMALGKEDVLYMHPLPADRGREVTDEVIDGPHSVVYDQAENRLHVQKALMALTM
jgi:ornithine carbamoyltransferase